MHKRFLVILLAVMLLSTSVVSAQPTPAQSYWQELKTIYEEWTAMDGETSMDITFQLPGEDAVNVSVHMVSTSDMDTFVSHNVIQVTSDDMDMDIPAIEMYTQGTNIYVNTEFVLFLADLAGMSDAISINEAFVMLESSETQFTLDNNFLMEVLEFIEGMEIGFEINMTLEDDVYELTLTSDEIIDLLNAYMLHVMNNLDELTAITGQAQGLELSQEDMDEALAAYKEMIEPMLAEAKAAINGSSYTATTVFGDDTYTEQGELIIISPFFNMTLTTDSTANKLNESNIQLPTSVKIYTEEDLTNLLLGSMGMNDTNQPTAIIMVDDNRYMHLNGTDITEGEVNIQILDDNRAYLSAADAVILFGIPMEPSEELVSLRIFEDYGYELVWNPEYRFIELYR